jgi:hypothetical protein
VTITSRETIDRHATEPAASRPITAVAECPVAARILARLPAGSMNALCAVDMNPAGKEDSTLETARYDGTGPSAATASLIRSHRLMTDKLRRRDLARLTAFNTP